MHLWKISGRRRQDSGVEGLELTSFHENIKITTNCWTTINKRSLEPTKKDILHQKTKKKPQQDSKKDTFVIKSNPIPTGWATPKLENKYITEVFPQKWEYWAPHQAPQPDGLALGGASELLALKASGTWVQELHRTGGNRDSTLGGCTPGFMCTGTQGKAEAS